MKNQEYQNQEYQNQEYQNQEVEEIKQNKESKKNKKKSIRMLILAALGLVAVSIVSIVYAWFFYTRQIDTFTWIKTPIRLEIGSGNNHSIVYLDMGSIDAENNTSADYVFCVYGEPVDLYSLQLAYTTNIAFNYDIYRAELSDGKSNGDKQVPFTYTDESGTHTEQFCYDPNSKPIIQAKSLDSMSSEEIKKHQSHRLSYGDDEGQNPIPEAKVQKNAQPLYWLANENNLNVLQPENIQTNTKTQNQYFCDYFVIHVSWQQGAVLNDKETDMVYLTASR